MYAMAFAVASDNACKEVAVKTAISTIATGRSLIVRGLCAKTSVRWADGCGKAALAACEWAGRAPAETRGCSH